MNSFDKDSEIIRHIRCGRTNAYAELVIKYQRKVRGYCFHMIGEWTAAEDAAQEVFIKAYESLPEFRAQSSFSTWLFRITANHCLDVLKKVKRRKCESLEELERLGGNTFSNVLQGEANFASAIEYRSLIAGLLAGLDDKEREVVILREVQQLSYEEMCQVLVCSMDAVKARLKRARARLLEVERHLSRAETSEEKGPNL